MKPPLLVLFLEMTPADADLLKKVVFAVAPLPDAAWQDFSACWHPLTCSRKTTLTAAGQVEPYAYFILEGVQRAYHLTENRKEATLIFSYKGSFGGVVDSFQLQQPSRYFFETLTTSRLLRLSYADFARLMAQYPALEQWGRLATARALSGLMERHIELLAFSAEEKFRILLTRSPHVLGLIPHKYLASYLGLDPTTFSKLLASVKL